MGGVIFGPEDEFWVLGPAREQSDAARPLSSFAYYTDAATAQLIIAGQKVWLRAARRLNDTGEISYGLQLAHRAMSSPGGRSLLDTLENLHVGARDIFSDKLESMAGSLVEEVYVACVSGHTPEEDNLGRLSMWRAYGRGDGVAIVLRKEVFLNWSTAPVYAMPVHYGESALTGDSLAELAELLEITADMAGPFELDALVDLALASLQMRIVQSKHPAFAEEKEWRIIHLPNNPTFLDSIAIRKASTLVRRTVELGGESQEIYELSILPAFLLPSSGAELKTPTLDDVLGRVLIGPSADPGRRREEFVRLLHENGVGDAESRVSICDVPLRI